MKLHGRLVARWVDNTEIALGAILCWRTNINISSDIHSIEDDYEGAEIIYGIEQHDPSVQQLGRVSTRQSRLSAFPNVLQHRASPLSRGPFKTGSPKDY